jgi:hypothetical protein
MKLTTVIIALATCWTAFLTGASIAIGIHWWVTAFLALETLALVTMLYDQIKE